MVVDLAALVDHRVDALEGGGDLGGEGLVGRLEGGDVVLQGENVRLRVVGFVAQGGDLYRILLIVCLTQLGAKSLKISCSL